MNKLFAVLCAYAALVCGIVLLFGHNGAKSTLPTIYVRNLSTFVSDSVVRHDLPAFQTALSRDFAPVWGGDARLVFIGRKAAPAGSRFVVLLDKSDVKGALAYHELTNGVADSRIFIGTSRYYGYDWTVGFTHELFEMQADPNIARTEQDQHTGTIWAGEVCDPVESDADGYLVDGVRISDFITEKWFNTLQAGPFDFVGHVQVPLAIDKGGYAQWWNGAYWNIVANFRHGGRGAGEHW